MIPPPTSAAKRSKKAKLEITAFVRDHFFLSAETSQPLVCIPCSFDNTVRALCSKAVKLAAGDSETDAVGGTACRCSCGTATARGRCAPCWDIQAAFLRWHGTGPPCRPAAGTPPSSTTTSGVTLPPSIACIWMLRPTAPPFSARLRYWQRPCFAIETGVEAQCPSMPM